MNVWKYAVITTKGLALQAKLIEGTSLNITKAVSGAGYVNPTLLQSMTTVSTERQTLAVKSIKYPEEGKCALTVFLTNDGLETGYQANQIGIYAEDPDEGEILYFIAEAESGYGTQIPTETEMPGYHAEWTFYFQYGNADNVNVSVDPANVHTKLEAHLENTENPHKVTAEQAGAVSTEIFQIYQRLSDCSYLTKGETTREYIEKIPPNTSVILPVSSGTFADQPTTSGLLIVHRGSSIRASSVSLHDAGLCYRYYTINSVWKEEADHIKTYSDLNQIGLSVGTETIETIASNIPDDAVLYYNVNTNNAAIYPVDYGVLKVEKTDSTRVFFTFYEKTSARRYFGVYDGTMTEKWSGWEKFVTLNNLNEHAKAVDNPHKVTKEQVGLGNVPNITTKIATYTNFPDIGISNGSETIGTIAEKLPENSELLASIGTENNTSIYPTTYGVLHVLKKNSSRVEFKFYSKSGTRMWIGNYDSTTTTKWYGWATVLNAGDVVDNLTSTSTNMPLSAKQGNVLRQQVEVITGTLGAITETNPSVVDVPNDTKTLITSVTLSPGRYIVQFGGWFPKNGNGSRLLLITDSTSPLTVTPKRKNVTSAAAIADRPTYLTNTTTVYVTSQATYSLVAIQSSGETLEFYGYINCMQIQ